MLLTIGDECFETNNIASSSSRNPLALDELKSLSRRLLIIAFTLFQREGLADWDKGSVAPNVRFTWENVREKVMQCLVAIHLQEYVYSESFRSKKCLTLYSSRQPFVPPDHWVVGSQIDMDSFTEAAM